MYILRQANVTMRFDLLWKLSGHVGLLWKCYGCSLSISNAQYTFTLFRATSSPGKLGSSSSRILLNVPFQRKCSFVGDRAWWDLERGFLHSPCKHAKGIWACLRNLPANMLRWSQFCNVISYWNTGLSNVRDLVSKISACTTIPLKFYRQYVTACESHPTPCIHVCHL